MRNGQLGSVGPCKLDHFHNLQRWDTGILGMPVSEMGNYGRWECINFELSDLQRWDVGFLGIPLFGFLKGGNLGS